MPPEGRGAAERLPDTPSSPERTAPVREAAPPSSVAATLDAAAWVERLRERGERLAACGIDYVHLVIPDGTEPAVRRRLREAGADALPVVLGLEHGAGPVPLVETLRRSTVLLGERLGLPIAATVPAEGVSGADGPPAPRARRRHANALVRHAEREGRVDEAALQPASLVVYENASAEAAARRIVLFGGAFAGLRAGRLTGLLAESVRELHFLWSADLDDDYIARVRPDAVVTVLAAGAMARVPDDDFDVELAAAERLVLDRSRAVPPVPSSALEPADAPIRLLERERYRVAPPIAVQRVPGDVIPESTLRAGGATLVEAVDATLALEGTRWTFGAAADGIAHRSLGGTTLLLDEDGEAGYRRWMLELLPRLGLLERHGVPPASLGQLIVRGELAGWQRETLARFGVPGERVIAAGATSRFRCERLLRVEIDPDGPPGAWMHRFVPLWLKHAWPPREPIGEPTKLHLLPGPGARRPLANERETRALLERAGFESVVLEERSVAEQAALLARADALVGTHADTLAGMVFCRPGIPVVELFGRHVYPHHHALATLCGHRYHAVLERPAEDGGRLLSHRVAAACLAPEVRRRTRERPVEVPLDALERVLALL